MHQPPAFHLPHRVRINMILTVVKTVTDMVRNTFESLTQTKFESIKAESNVDVPRAIWVCFNVYKST